MTLTVGWYVKSFRIFAPGTDHFRMAPRVYLKSVISSARNNMSQMSASAMADLLSPGPFDPNLRGLLYLDCLRFVSYGVYGCRTAQRRRNQRQNLCNTEALSHGERQKINGFYSDRRRHKSIYLLAFLRGAVTPW